MPRIDQRGLSRNRCGIQKVIRRFLFRKDAKANHHRPGAVSGDGDPVVDIRRENCDAAVQVLDLEGWRRSIHRRRDPGAVNREKGSIADVREPRAGAAFVPQITNQYPCTTRHVDADPVAARRAGENVRLSAGRLAGGRRPSACDLD